MSSTDPPSEAEVQIRDDDGNPLQLTLNGDGTDRTVRVLVPAHGAVTLKSSGDGSVQTGAIRVTADRPLSGFVLFDAGTGGVAGVGESAPLLHSRSPVETGSGVNSGIAVMGLGKDQILDPELRSGAGEILARASLLWGEIGTGPSS